MLSYEEVVASLRDLPQTWYPGLLIALARISYERGDVWQPAGASRAVRKLEEREGFGDTP